MTTPTTSADSQLEGCRRILARRLPRASAEWVADAALFAIRVVQDAVQACPRSPRETAARVLAHRERSARATAHFEGIRRRAAAVLRRQRTSFLAAKASDIFGDAECPEPPVRPVAVPAAVTATAKPTRGKNKRGAPSAVAAKATTVRRRTRDAFNDGDVDDDEDEHSGDDDEVRTCNAADADGVAVTEDFVDVSGEDKCDEDGELEDYSDYNNDEDASASPHKRARRGSVSSSASSAVSMSPTAAAATEATVHVLHATPDVIEEADAISKVHERAAHRHCVQLVAAMWTPDCDAQAFVACSTVAERVRKYYADSW